ncbi:MAG: hypothetical protein Q8Q35_02950, partial [Nanoarchaeota archaeon]|nr:hypothetical protein [Nanoarchaeota archaeon]
LSLLVMTKTLGLALVPLTFLVFLFLKPKIKTFKLTLTHYLTSAIIIAPYLFWKITFSLNSTLGYPKELTTNRLITNLTYNLITFINWYINYIGYAILATGIIFGIYFIAGYFVKKKQNLKTLYILTSLSSLLFIFLASNHSSGYELLHNSPFVFFTYRPIGRYIATIFPFIILTGFIVYKNKLINKSKLLFASLITSMILVISTQLTLSPLFPINNASLTYFGLLQYIIEFLLYSKTTFDTVFHWGSFIIIGLLLLTTPLLVYKLRNKINFTKLIFLFLILNILLASAVHIWNVESYWADNDQTKMGKWINDNINNDKIILMDTTSCNLDNKDKVNTELCVDGGFKSTVIGLWIINPIITKGKADYLITTEEKKLTLIKQIGVFKLYENT